MMRLFLIGLLGLAFLVLLSCDKERIVESTEIIKEIEYVEVPPDTVFIGDSVVIYEVDTVIRYDTVHQGSTDTVVMTEYVYDTVMIRDTVETVVTEYDTVTVVDTVMTVQCNPNEHLAFTALQYYTDPLVIDMVNQEFGLTDGWIFYLSQFQTDLSNQSSGVYDFYGYIDYWTPDWSGYYPIEYFWRVSYVSGDPANPENWNMTEPPTAVSGERRPSLRIIRDIRIDVASDR